MLTARRLRENSQQAPVPQATTVVREPTTPEGWRHLHQDTVRAYERRLSEVRAGKGSTTRVAELEAALASERKRSEALAADVEQLQKDLEEALGGVAEVAELEAAKKPKKKSSE